MAETSLLPIIVGGLLGIGGIGVTGGITLIVNQQQSSREKKKRRSDKFEELVAAVYEFDHWIDNHRRKVAYGQEWTETVSPFAKVQSISSVYFPQYDRQIIELKAAASGYRSWMSGYGGKRLAGTLDPLESDGFGEAYRPYLEKLNTLLDALKEFAREEFQ
jgi:hypothetical protein